MLKYFQFGDNKVGYFISNLASKFTRFCILIGKHIL